MKFWKTLTTDLDSVKGGILACAGLAVLGTAGALLQWTWLRGYEKNLPTLDRQFQAVVETSRAIREYEDQKKRDSLLQAQASPTHYIETQAFSARLGQIRIDDREGRGTGSKDYEDHVFTINSALADGSFTRYHLAFFCWMLESQSRRMKVTSIHANPAESRKRSGEVKDDSWKFTIVATTRSRREPG